MGTRSKPLTHLDARGRVAMVDVTSKPATTRTAWAEGELALSQEGFLALRSSDLKKGDALAVAHVAGIQAAKGAHQLIPLCHPLHLTHVDVEYFWQPSSHSIRWAVKCVAREATGCEMEALAGAAAVGLTLHDMVKAVDPWCELRSIRLLGKSGGKGGDQRRKGWTPGPKNTSGR